MTSQTEESKENDGHWLDFYDALHGEVQKENDVVTRLQKEYDHFVVLLSKAKGKKYHDLAFKKRFLATQLWVHSEAKITKLLVYMLALRIAILEKEIRTQPTPELEEQLKEVKKAFDDHLAKRLAQLFDTSGHEAMYGA